MKAAEHKQKPKSIEGVFPEDLENNEIKNELSKIKKIEKEIDRNYLKYEISKCKNEKSLENLLTIFIMVKLQ